MARTHPQYDWTEPQPGYKRSNGAEWESLRNELVALLDQVEDQVATVHSARARPVPAKPVPAAETANDRHSEALRSVRHAVTRLADRPTEERPVMRDSVIDAIGKIRARQTGGAQPAPAPVPASPPAASPETSQFADFARSLDALGDRIGQFESSIGEQIATLGGHEDISTQIAQLSEVIELLAGAVGETGQIKHIEAQIGTLAEAIATERHSSTDATNQRIDDLSGIIEKLVTHQIDTSRSEARSAAEADERQTRTMAMIEQSVRDIYDRIDSLEDTQSNPSEAIERLGRDMAALADAVSHQSDPQELLARIDTLSARIAGMEPPSRNEATLLAESVSVLRDVIAETIEPRFARLEQRIDVLGTAEPAPTDDIEAQLRHIAQRVDDASAQLRNLAALDAQPAPALPDFSVLADLIAQKTREAEGLQQRESDGVEKADLDALEDRLATLFAQSANGEREAEHLEGVRSSIAQVDNRIARLEALLNTRPVAAPEAEAAPRPRRKPDDAMPADPTTGEAHRAADPFVDVPEHGDPAPAVDTAFAIDPATIARPAKPQPSFIAGGETSTQPVLPERKRDSTPEMPNVSRASFIEAARRSARQPEPVVEDEPKSLIARALARFQRSEAELAPEPAADALPVSAPLMAETLDAIEDDLADEGPLPGFFARNRRALLLGTALVVVAALALPLALNRIMPARPDNSQTAALSLPAEPASADVEAEAPAPDTVLEELSVIEPLVEDDASEADSLISDVRIIEQPSRLTAAQVDAQSFTATPTIDPMVTAAISPAASSYAATGTAASAADAIVAQLPAIAVPEAIEPEALRAAAEDGDRFAQFEVGALLTEGTVVEQDFAQAAAWYERSAAQGFAPAQYRLASLYESGRGVERDLELARLWYQRAAEAGNRMSMHNLASLYAGGELASQDFSAAAHWFEEAAARGMTDSQFNLGMLHARGLGVDQDFEQSYVWFSLAARSGDEDAANARDDVVRSLDADAIRALDETIGAWKPSEIDLAANFAPIGTWDTAFDPGPAIGNRDVILRVQMLLGKLGYDIGSPDGISGPKTREAIVAFERATGMSESGAINPRLLAVLGSQPV
ncbi:MAG TPA: peptidoglycan-binding protein [Pelagibacterium sp.]|uniref:peptidoglycan-binding protein n=1 Tax=Pelagibacterium sp. TaxID=1967288 RepID=UPI002C2FEBB5|nr:peptidoglycan-binding protein [Pelagibacterium sp.]HWJ89007.1 peptidoglycan-binding protein [Pelagibacterium sp.]